MSATPFKRGWNWYQQAVFGRGVTYPAIVLRIGNLLGQRGRNEGLCIAAALQQCWQTPVVAIRKQPEAIKQPLHAAKHWAA